MEDLIKKIKEKRMAVIAKHIANGVIFNSLEDVNIDENVVIGKGTIIDRDNEILGNTVIGSNARISIGNIIENAQIGSEVYMLKSVVRDSEIGRNTTVGPYANIHTHSNIGRDCRVGNFVEIKNSHIGINTKMAHLAYVGDTDIGNKCNIGCGAIFINYDGKNKHRSVIGDSVFIGSNCNIVAPVNIENNAFIAAGTTVTVDLPTNCMCIGRNREVIKENRSKYHKCDFDKKYFGTDGIRGVYGKKLTDEIAYKTGNFLGYSSDKGVVVVGRDTRISGEQLSQSLIQGIIDAGAKVIDLGVTTTPSVAYVTQFNLFNYGVMITASHNPPEYNGIKIFNNKGAKLINIEEVEIERHIDHGVPYISDIPGVVEDGEGYLAVYLAKMTDICGRIDGIKVVADCSNGAMSAYAKRMFESVGAECTCIYDSGDGKNINNGCGALHPETCAKEVVRVGADIGFSFDGDADRLIAVDKNGKVVDGDEVIYILAKYLKDNGRLNNNTAVGTILTNIGIENSLEKIGIRLERTDVGDHNVAEMMTKHSYCVGGEQSGHIIMGEFESTGDGLLTALYLCKIVQECGGDLASLVTCTKYPQTAINIITEQKNEIAKDERVLAYKKEQETNMNGEGRIVLRASGTEPKLRIMVECANGELAKQTAENIKNYIQELYK